MNQFLKFPIWPQKFLIIDQTPKKGVLIVQEDWNAKVGKDTQADRGHVCRPYCNDVTNESGLSFLEFTTFNSLVLTNTLALTNHQEDGLGSPDGKHHSQTDYILARKRFCSGINIHKTRSLPGADIGSDHDLVMPRLNLTWKVKGPRCGMCFSTTNIREIYITYRPEGWCCWHRYHGYHLQYSIDWRRQWETWERSS